MRRLHLFTATLLLTSFVALAKKPNVLFIISDDLTTHVSPSGYKHIKTPSLEKLASEGMTLQRAYCQYPVCGPSRASLLSGLYPDSNGVLDNKTDIRKTRPDAVTMPQVFKEGGYWTGSVGKVFHNEKTDHGDVAWNEGHWFENDEMPLVTPHREKFEAQYGKIDSSKKIARKWKEYELTIAPQTANQKPGYGPSGLRDQQHKDGKNVRRIISWLKKKPYGDKPFFMACGIHKPHGPYLAPDKYFDMYPTNELVFEPASMDYWKQAPKIAMTKRFKGFDFEFGKENDPLRRKYIQAYHACITFIDTQIGMVFDALKEEGYWDNTIIVFVADNGYLLGEKFMWGKVFLWDKCARIPMIVRAPGLTKPGTISQSLAELVDVFPTLTDLCDVKAPEYLQGKSLAPILKDPSAKVKDEAFTVVRRGKGEAKLGRTIHTDRWHYVSWHEGKHEELYDLHKDPKELKNLAKSPEHRELIQKMKQKLAQTIQRAKAEKK